MALYLNLLKYLDWYRCYFRTFWTQKFKLNILRFWVKRLSQCFLSSRRISMNKLRIHHIIRTKGMFFEFIVKNHLFKQNRKYKSMKFDESCIEFPLRNTTMTIMILISGKKRLPVYFIDW